MSIAADNHLADALRDAIAASGLTQYDLAKKSGITQIRVSEFRRGSRDLTLSSASKLASVLGLGLSGKSRRKPAKSV